MSADAWILAAMRRLPLGRRLGVIINEHTLSAAATRAHVEALGRWFEFIPHDDVIDRLARPRSRPFCLLTFDDGKRSNATETAPELLRLGVPAVFYVTTGFLTGGAPLWFDRYDALRAALGHAPAGLETDVVKSLPLSVLEARIDRACQRHGVSYAPADDRIGAMSWDEARGLAAQGFTIGAHGVRHAVMTNESDAQARANIQQSIVDVTREIGRPCRTFAFPNGNYTAALAHWALQCGAQTVTTTDPIWVRVGASRWRLPRVQLFPHMGQRACTVKLAVAATGMVLRNPDGTGRLYRRIDRLDRQQASVRGRGSVDAVAYSREPEP